MMPIRDLVAGRWDGPVAKAEEAVGTWRRTGERFRLGDGLVWLAVVYARAGRPADARVAMAEAGALFDDADSPLGMLSVLLGQSYLARWEERYQDAVRLAGAADALRDQVGGRAPSTSWPGSSATRRPRPAPTSRPMSRSGPGGRAAPQAWTRPWPRQLMPGDEAAAASQKPSWCSAAKSTARMPPSPGASDCTYGTGWAPSKRDQAGRPGAGAGRRSNGPTCGR
jgi:hypothetical protein